MRADTAVYCAFDDHEPWDTALPERNLMRAILRSALHDVQKQGELYREARRYLLSEDEAYLYSFRSICAHLGYCPKTIIRLSGISAEESDRIAA